MLVECFKENTPQRYLLSKPVVMMNPRRLDGATPEEVEESRRLFAESQRGDNNPACRSEVREKIRQARLNMTPEQRRVISEHHADVSGERNPFYGKHHTEDSIQKMREHFPDRSGPSNAFYSKTHSEETRRKISESRRGTTHSDDSRRRMGESKRGNQNAKGNMWITNGVSNIVIKDPKDLPEGWRFGRTILCKSKGDSIE